MTKKKLLFVCLGNICRSPMAEAVFERILERENATEAFEIDSAGLIAYHAGELPDSRMRQHAGQRGYKAMTHRSRPFRHDDFEQFDMILAMDDQNIDGLHDKALKPEDSKKIYRITDFCRTIAADHVPDPYYGGSQGFEKVIDLLEDACEGLWESIQAEK